MDAVEFTLDDGLHHGANAVTALSAAGDGSATPTMGCGRKPRVCVAFYESAQCPCKNRCEHAHHFSELDVCTQERLLETVPLNRIPKHFIMPLGVTKRHVPTAAPSADGPSAMYLPAHDEKGRVAGQHSSGHAARVCERSNSNLCDVSMLSLTSSTSSAFVSSPQNSRDVSPRKWRVRAEASEAFRIRLPARCRYPHRATSGTYYDVLGVSQDATQEEILACYNRWKIEYKRLKHIDQQRADAHDTLVVEARNVIGHPVLRVEYDRTVPNQRCWDSMLAAAAISSMNLSHSANVSTPGTYNKSIPAEKNSSGAHKVTFAVVEAIDNSNR